MEKQENRQFLMSDTSPSEPGSFDVPLIRVPGRGAQTFVWNHEDDMNNKLCPVLRAQKSEGPEERSISSFYEIFSRDDLTFVIPGDPHQIPTTYHLPTSIGPDNEAQAEVDLTDRIPNFCSDPNVFADSCPNSDPQARKMTRVKNEIDSILNSSRPIGSRLFPNNLVPDAGRFDMRYLSDHTIDEQH